VGVFQRGWAEASVAHAMQLRAIAVLSLAGVVLGAWYMLWMYQRVFFGPERLPKTSPLAPGNESNDENVRDLTPREIFCLTPLAAMIFWIGLQPGFFLERMRPTLDDLIAPVTRACETASDFSASSPTANRAGQAPPLH